MFRYELAVQSDTNQRAIVDLLREAASSGTFTRLRAAFAYASAGGVQLASWAMADVSTDWEALEKRWLISIDWGHTDPEALEFLASLPRSRVRVPYAETVLSRNLIPSICFHPKTAIFDCGRMNSPPISILVGSANLTVSGLETGHEHAAAAIWLSGTLARDAGAQLAAMRRQATHIESVWRAASPLTPTIVDQYRRKRHRRGGRSEDESDEAQRIIRDARGGASRFVIPLDRSAQLASAQNLWVDIHYVVENRGRGVPGNQIDLQRGTRVFFGFSARSVPRNTLLGDVVISHRGHTSTHHMRFGNNYMDKLNLPIPGAGGPPAYRATTLVFERQRDGRFRMRVGTRSEVRSWKRQSRQEGTLFTMQGGREWGIFS